MKINNSPEVFEPVTVTLETKEELDALYTVAGSISGSGSFKDTTVRMITNRLWDGLQDCGAKKVEGVVEIELELGQ